MKIQSSIFVFLSAIGLSACGGGSGGDAGSSPESGIVASTLSFNIDNAFKTLTASGFRKVFSTISGTCGGTAVLEETAVTGPASFETAINPISAIRTFTPSFTGCKVPNTIVNTTLYYDANYTPLGFWTLGNTYAVYVSPGPIYPTSVKVGTVNNPSIGNIGTLLKYEDSAKVAPVGKLELSYRVTADTESTAILTIVGQNFDASATPKLVVTQEDSYRVSVSGAPTLISMKILDNTGTTTNLLFQ